MKIQKLTLDEKEMISAVQMFLATKGINMPVHSISREYSWKKETEITFEFEVEPAVPAPIKEAPPTAPSDSESVETKESF